MLTRLCYLQGTRRIAFSSIPIPIPIPTVTRSLPTLQLQVPPTQTRTPTQLGAHMSSSSSSSSPTSSISISISTILSHHMRCLRPIHYITRTSHPRGYPPRFPVDDAHVRWNVAYPEYKPSDYTAPNVLKKSRDPVDPHFIHRLDQRFSYELDGRILIDEPSGRPLNPVGRTGLSGRGKLYMWGPNHAADPIITRHNAAGAVEFILISRRDTGEWAFPGGMCDLSETPVQTARREFVEEALNVPAEKQKHVQQLLDEIICQDKMRMIHNGYIDDPRNTDNSWIETVGIQYHVTDQRIASELESLLHAGDDATKVRWMSVEENTNVYPSHRGIINYVQETTPSSPTSSKL